MFIPRKRLKPMKSAYKERSLPQFRRWVKTLGCSVKGCQNADIDPAHIRCDLPADALKGGTSIKSHDIWIIPLCRMHHNEQGDDGERSFYVKYKLAPVALAATLLSLWQRETPAGRKYQQEQSRLSGAPCQASPTTSEE